MFVDGLQERHVLNGRYRIVRKLGEGGMGAVWLAEDILLDRRRVAIKTLPAHIVNDRQASERLRREAQISLQLNHQNLAAVRAFEVNNNQPYFVMDYVEGQTLSEHIRQYGPMADVQVFDIFAPLAEALNYAHNIGVIHRDIKPTNIILKPNGDPVLLDFGVSVDIRELARSDGQISGTIPYMSPEQISGASPNTSQDIYSLAASAYECLTGHPPFFQGDIVEQILHKDSPRIDCACWFCAQINFCISKNPAGRSRTALQFANRERRHRLFMFWVLIRAQEMTGLRIYEDRIAMIRLEEGVEQCLKKLRTQKVVSIDLPYRFPHIPARHFELSVSWDDLRALHW